MKFFSFVENQRWPTRCTYQFSTSLNKDCAMEHIIGISEGYLVGYHYKRKKFHRKQISLLKYKGVEKINKICHIQYRAKVLDHARWIPSEDLWSRCPEEWKPLSSPRATRRNIKHFLLFLLFICRFVTLKLNKIIPKSHISQVFVRDPRLLLGTV